MSNEYDGVQSTTNSGNVCQRWDSQVPHRHNMVSDLTIVSKTDAKNFCRDADRSGIPWCYTIDPSIRWEACPVKNCSYKFEDDECYDDDLLSMNYTGIINVTRTGKDCQRWDTQIPHNHNLTDGDFPEDVLSDAENYCRDPIGSGYTWCYTTDPRTRWEPCVVSSCTKYRNDMLCFEHFDNLLHYNGRWDLTLHNEKCLRWDSVNHTYTADKFPDDSLKEANNYCRNPDNSLSPLWCYVNFSEEKSQRQYCGVTKCAKYHTTCYDGLSVKSYIGTWNQTISGRTCQRWDADKPHSHNLMAEMFEEDSLEDAENYCRDPTNSGKLWCYTTDPKIEKERCGIGKCSGETTCQLFKDETVEYNMKDFVYVKLP
ncbi:hypothetical protein ACF0H5_014461 [Mactra antiquata]